MLNKLDELPANKSVFFIGRYSYVMKILENPRNFTVATTIQTEQSKSHIRKEKILK